MTKKQNEIDLLKYFMPNVVKHIDITQNDIDMYFEWSEKGKHKDKLKLSHFNDEFNALVTSKSRRGLQMRMWEEGMDYVPYCTLLGRLEKCITRKWYNPFKYIKGKYIFVNEPIPRNVVDYMKKEMFKGLDAEAIENTYQELIK